MATFRYFDDNQNNLFETTRQRHFVKYQNEWAALTAAKAAKDLG
jgi:hypothetical protein